MAMCGPGGLSWAGKSGVGGLRRRGPVMRECGPVRPCPACCAKDSMKPPAALHALIDDGVIDEVLRPLKSGKEAAVYVVRSGGEVRCAKRSEEHTSELRSLMRLSYAVFCLKKKNGSNDRLTIMCHKIPHIRIHRKQCVHVNW